MFGLIVLANAAVGLPLSIYGFTLYVSALHGVRTGDSWQNVVLAGITTFGPFVIYAALGLSFLWWGRGIIDRADPAERGESQAPVRPKDLARLEVSLVAVLGLYLVADGIAEFCRTGFGLNFRYGVDQALILSWHLDLPLVASAVARLLIGVALVLGRGGTIALLRGARAWVRKMRRWPD
jgi:hypothetical protein